MAPQLRRVFLTTVLVCAAVAVAYLPPRPPERISLRADRETARPMAVRHAHRLDDAVVRARRTLEVSRWRDALLAQMHTTGGGGIFVTTDVSADTPPVDARAAVESVWKALPRHDPTVRVGVAVTWIPDTLRTLNMLYQWNAWFLPPEATDGRTCIVMVALATPMSPATWRLGYRNGARLLGPCAYYAAFGRPGSGLQQWLDHGGGRYALDNNWRQPSDTGQAINTEYGTLYDWYYDSWDFTACRMGQVARCLRVVDAPDTRLTFAMQLNTTDLPGVLEWRTYRRFWGTAPRDRFLADMVGAFGVDRFATFWQSDASFDTAFAQAYGTPLATWTHRWVVASYFALPPGTHVTGREWLVSALCVVVLAGAGAGIAQRRGLE